MGDELVLEVDGKVGVHRAEAGNEMILIRADGSFGGIDTVIVGFYLLEVGTSGQDLAFERFGGSIVQDVLELGFQAMGGEELI